LKMSLPKIEHPIFELVLPSTKLAVKYRPFLVKEEKILLMAMQGEDPEEILNSVKQVINNCILSTDVNVDNLSTFDLEYLFIKIRAKSVNNIISLTYKDLEDEKRYDVEVDLDMVEIKTDPNHTNKIEVNSNTGFYLKYPQASISDKLKESNNETELFFDILKNCIDRIYQNDNEYLASECTSEELDEFVQNLDVKSFKKIQTFFSTMPKLYYETSYVNSLGNEKKIILTSLNDFFSLG